MASPFAQGVAWARSNPGLALGVGGGTVAVVVAVRHTAKAKSMSLPAAPSGAGLVAGAAGSDSASGAAAAAGFITQGAGIALQGAGLGLPYVAAGLGLAGQAVGVLGGAVSSLSGSQASALDTLASILRGYQPAAGSGTACGPRPTYSQPAGTVRVCLNGTWQDIPATDGGGGTPPPAPVPTVAGYRVSMDVGTVTAYIVSGAGAITPRTLTLSTPIELPVIRQGAGGEVGGHIYWRILAGGNAGLSLVEGVSDGPWQIVRVMSDGSTLSIPASGS